MGLHVENKLVEDNYKLVWSVVNKFHYMKEEKDDLFQSGCIGLIMAAKKFDVTRGNAFSTFAIPYILGEIKNYLRNKNHIKVSKKILSMQRKISKVLENNGNISISEVANKLDASYEDVLISFNTNNRMMSLENQISEDNNHTLIDLDSYDNHYNIDNSKLELKDIINRFSNVEKKIMFYRFYYGFNQNETATQLKISQSKVSRLEKKITDVFKNQYMVK
ncbi:MAG: polymerase, sigma 28 subunit, FliA/WhiG subfamily [Haloplasmataceae bacterium]|nr:polymerase, sigma 28 subunit, FliA/WhiG subfamily [Haloplasmataceae bacterium]